jgi:hypothetical protein
MKVSNLAIAQTELARKKWLFRILFGGDSLQERVVIGTACSQNPKSLLDGRTRGRRSSDFFDY